jgi:hypothetical protein
MKQTTPSRSKMQRAHKTVLIEDLVLIWNPPLIHVGFSRPSRETFEKLGPPRLFDGERAEHLTIPLVPMSYGPMAGRLHVHLTYGAGAERRHFTVAAIDPGAIDDALKPVGDALGVYYRRRARPVTIEGLRREGYVVGVLTDNAKDWLDNRACVTRWKERVTDARMLRAFDDGFEFLDVGVLEELRSDPRQHPAFAFREPDGFTISVGYQPHGVPPDNRPGWYALPADGGMRRVMDEALSGVLSTEVYDAFITIARELQAPMNIDAMLRGRARAASRNSRKTLGNRT